MERVAKRDRQTFNERLGTDVGKLPSDSTFPPLLAQLDTLVCDGKTLRGSIAQTDSGAAYSLQIACDRRSEGQDFAIHITRLENDALTSADTMIC